MSSSDRRTLLAGIAGLMTLGACGFRPAYAPGEAATRLRGSLVPREARNEDEFVFVARVDERLGTSDSAPLRLDYSISTDKDRRAISPSNSTLRYHLRGRLSYKVVDIATGETLTRGETANFTAYSAIGTTVATTAQENDAYVRLMVILADEMVTQLAATAESWLP